MATDTLTDLSPQAREIVGRAVDEWFATRPRLAAALAIQIPELKDLAVAEVARTPGYRALLAKIEEAEEAADAVDGILTAVKQAMPLLVSLLG
ncbi:MAG: hypothetical protein R6X20_02365 [Phycisphaerae bacterium]